MLTPRTLPNAPSYNVIADLKGSKYPDQIVVVSGHLDSWDLGTGALDDACGVAVSMQVPFLLKKLGFTPERTIRVIAHGGAPGESAPASPSPTTTPPEAGPARAAADETAPGADPEDGLAEDEGDHHHRSALGESAPGARRQPGGTSASAGRPGAAPAFPRPTPGPGLAAGDRKGPAGDKKGSGQAQAFRAELMDTLMRAIRPSIATSKPRTDGQAR